MDSDYEYLKKEYNLINNSFKKKCIYHVGIDAGLFSEIDAMMQAMLFCYNNKIKFVLYGDDANFARYGWETFFDPFTEMNHNPLNKKYNYRYSNVNYGKKYRLMHKVLKILEKSQYLTQDIFAKCIPHEHSQRKKETFELFDINGYAYFEFAKLSSLVLHYNRTTKEQIEKIIDNLNLPEHYVSIQFRGGDKILEFDKLNSVEEMVKEIDCTDYKVNDIFVLSDTYDYIESLRTIKPEWRIYTLCSCDEHGYVNSEFNSEDWSVKEKKILRLLAMVEICKRSDLHFGNEQTCLNNFLCSYKQDKYYPVLRCPDNYLDDIVREYAYSFSYVKQNNMVDSRNMYP